MSTLASALIAGRGSAFLAGSIASRGLHLHDNAPTIVHHFGNLHLEVERAAPFGETSHGTRGYGAVLQIGVSEFIAAGRGFSARFVAAAEREDVEVPRMEEGNIVAGEWGGARCINGDEAARGNTQLHPPLIPHRSESFPILGAVEHTEISRNIVHVFPGSQPMAGDPDSS